MSDPITPPVHASGDLPRDAMMGEKTSGPAAVAAAPGHESQHSTVSLTQPGDSGKLPRLAMRPREAAEALGIGERLLWSLTNRGEIPHLRLGKAILYPIETLQAWLDHQAAKGVLR